MCFNKPCNCIKKCDGCEPTIPKQFPKSDCFSDCGGCKENTLPLPEPCNSCNTCETNNCGCNQPTCGQCTIGATTLVATPFINCNVTRCNTGCAETFPFDCLSYENGCKVFMTLIRDTCNNGQTTLTISPTIFGEGAAGWELYIDGVFHSINMGQKVVDIDTSASSLTVTKIIKVKDREKGCEGSVSVVFPTCPIKQCYSITIPKLTAADDNYMKVSMYALHPITAFSEGILDMTFNCDYQDVQPAFRRYLLNGTYVASYSWTTGNCAS